MGEFKAASHEEALQRHLALSIAERLERSWRLYETQRSSARRVERGEGALQFYARAQELGMYEP